MKKTPLKRKSKNNITKIKDEIQELLRLNAIQRDGGCVLRYYSDAGNCGGYRSDGGLILQAEHLNGRANSVSFGEMDNIVCLCQYHHIFFKKQNNALYWLLIEKHIGKKRWEQHKKWVADRSPHPMRMYDWIELRDKLKSKVQEYENRS